MKILTVIPIILFFALTFVHLSSSVHAAITCPSCEAGSCTCIVGACASGTFSVYSTPGCSRDPVFEYTFNARNVPWAPDSAGTFYVQAYCDDGVTFERCVPMTVSSLESATTTTTEETSGSSTTETGGGGGGGGGLDTTWIIVAIIIVIAIIAFVVYRLFFTKKKSKGATYEELYRKWGARSR